MKRPIPLAEKPRTKNLETDDIAEEPSWRYPFPRNVAFAAGAKRLVFARSRDLVNDRETFSRASGFYGDPIYSRPIYLAFSANAK